MSLTPAVAMGQRGPARRMRLRELAEDAHDDVVAPATSPRLQGNRRVRRQIHRTLQLALIRRITLLNARRKLCESHGLSLSEWIVAEIRRPSKAKSTLSSARAEASLCHKRSNSAFSITLLSSAINLCIAGVLVIPLLNPPQMSDAAEGDVRSAH